MKYNLDTKTSIPDFAYMVQIDGNLEQYWLYNNSEFDVAYAQMKLISLQNSGLVSMLIPYLDNTTKEWKVRRIFHCFKGKAQYLENSRAILLHLKFYMDAGEWQNPHNLSN